MTNFSNIETLTIDETTFSLPNLRLMTYICHETKIFLPGIDRATFNDSWVDILGSKVLKHPTYQLVLRVDKAEIPADTTQKPVIQNYLQKHIGKEVLQLNFNNHENFSIEILTRALNINGGYIIIPQRNYWPTRDSH